MWNHHGILIPYFLQIGFGVIKVISLNTAVEKTTISLANVHGRILPEIQVGEEKFAASPTRRREESKSAIRSADENRYIFPLKVMLKRTQSRTLLFESRTERDKMQSAIIEQQGFENQLD